jgi:hypothetical protein
VGGGVSEAIHGLDDDVAALALRAVREDLRRPLSFVLVRCQRCEGLGMVDTDMICTNCRDDSRWARVNRAFCDLVHRHRPRLEQRAGSAAAA